MLIKHYISCTKNFTASKSHRTFGTAMFLKLPECDQSESHACFKGQNIPEEKSNLPPENACFSALPISLLRR